MHNSGLDEEEIKWILDRTVHWIMTSNDSDARGIRMMLDNQGIIPLPLSNKSVEPD